MALLPTPDNPASDFSPSDLSEVGDYPDENDGFTHGLVVLAMGLPYWLVLREGRFRLMIEPGNSSDARRQLTAFDRESATWPPRPMIDRSLSVSTSPLTPLFWVLVTLGAYYGQHGAWGNWEDLGILDTQAVFDHGQVWRVATALFLHADIGHLVSNLACGFVVFTSVVATFGTAWGWSLVLLASVCGNGAVAALNYPGPYRSLGASTAIFAGLGLLTGRAVRAVWSEAGGPRWSSLFVPFAAGLTLLGLLGAGDLQTDVGAHAAGFAAGFCWGAGTARFDQGGRTPGVTTN